MSKVLIEYDDLSTVLDIIDCLDIDMPMEMGQAYRNVQQQLEGPTPIILTDKQKEVIRCAHADLIGAKESAIDYQDT
jgi:hypothetical protein